MTPKQLNEAEIQHAARGHGPLWQRDYYARIQGSRLSPEEIIRLARRELPALSPKELAEFSRPGSTPGAEPIAVGEDMKVVIQGYGECGVRCVHVAPRSFTLRTLEGHLEAGRITFGAHEEAGELVFRICSRARSVDRLRHAGYQLIGQKLQEKTWQIFLERIAEETGGELAGEIEVETQEVKSTLADMGELDTPTFVVPGSQSEN